MDEIYLKRALEAAEIGRGFCGPNPSVGAVVVNNSSIISVGYHKGAGAPHAEVEALNVAGEKARGSSIYVTLEPCCHQGKTPPCTDLLINRGISRVVYAYVDPNPAVSGKGVRQLQASNILVDRVEMEEVTTFYEAYAHWISNEEPFVTAKLALSLDGKTAGEGGSRKRISGESMSEFTHLNRRRTDAILTTVRTVTLDNPSLDARARGERIPKSVYVLDTHLHFPEGALLLKTSKKLTLFCGPNPSRAREEKLRSLGVMIVKVGETEAGLDWKEVMIFLGKEGVHDLFVEAGGKCIESLAKAGFLHRAYLSVSPKWLGERSTTAFNSSAAFLEKASSIEWMMKGRDALCELRW